MTCPRCDNNGYYCLDTRSTTYVVCPCPAGDRFRQPRPCDTNRVGSPDGVTEEEDEA